MSFRGKGTVFIISAPSGAGKTSLVKSIVQSLPDIRVSVSYTTRLARIGEAEGADYHFVSQEDFNIMRNEGNFLEHATVFEKSYGTSRVWVEETVNKGIDVILEIDWQGARQIRTHLFDTVSIYILPPSREILSERLANRHPEKNELVDFRMQKAKDELVHFSEYDYLVMNDDFDKALKDLVSIVHSVRLQRRYQELKYLQVLESLVS
jgi:guanylate kinase